jgi:predicted N-acetyltransferase YhbS
VNDHANHSRPELVIRPIHVEDAAAAAVLVQQLGYSRTEDEISEWIKTLPQRAPNQAAFVACIAGDVVGWIEISIQQHLQSPPFVLIGGLVVKDGFRNQRIGLQLCEHVEAWSWERGIPVVRVTSRSTRLDAHRFYERNGYQTIKLSHVFEKHQPPPCKRKRPLK